MVRALSFAAMFLLAACSFEWPEEDWREDANYAYYMTPAGMAECVAGIMEVPVPATLPTLLIIDPLAPENDPEKLMAEGKALEAAMVMKLREPNNGGGFIAGEIIVIRDMFDPAPLFSHEMAHYLGADERTASWVMSIADWCWR